MKKLLILASVFAILVGMSPIIPVNGATNNSSLVFKADLVDAESTSCIASGQIMVWNNAKMEIQLFIENAPGGQTYDINMNYAGGYNVGPLHAYVGAVTTGNNGIVIKYFDLSQVELPNGNTIEPGTPIVSLSFDLFTSSEEPKIVAATGFVMPPPKS